MAKVTIWKASKKVYSGTPEKYIPPPQIQEFPQAVKQNIQKKARQKQITHEQALNKFRTCSERSSEEVSRTVRLCCSTRERTGFECNLLKIFPLSETNCGPCPHYKQIVNE